MVPAGTNTILATWTHTGNYIPARLQQKSKHILAIWIQTRTTSQTNIAIAVAVAAAVVAVAVAAIVAADVAPVVAQAEAAAAAAAAAEAAGADVAAAALAADVVVVVAYVAAAAAAACAVAVAAAESAAVHAAAAFDAADAAVAVAAGVAADVAVAEVTDATYSTHRALHDARSWLFQDRHHTPPCQETYHNHATANHHICLPYAWDVRSEWIEVRAANRRPGHPDPRRANGSHQAKPTRYYPEAL